MKIVNRKEFLALPAGVIYAKFEPCIFGDLAIKGDSLNDDWYHHDLIEVDAYDSGEWADKLFAGMEKGISIPLDFDTVSRDGMHDKDQLFAVFEIEDVYSLIRMLKNTVVNYPKDLKNPKDEKEDDDSFLNKTYRYKYTWIKGREEK